MNDQMDMDLDKIPEDHDPMDEPDLQGVVIPDTVLNLLPVLKDAAKKDEKYEKLLKELPQRILDDMSEGEASRAEWLEATKERMELWRGKLEEKDFPYENCANVNDPVLLSRCIRIVARIYGELFKRGQPLFSAQSNRRMSRDRAEAITRHQNQQFRKTIPDFQRHFLRGIHAFVRDGEAVWHSYRDSEGNVNRHDYMKSDRFIYPYTIESSATDMSDVPWKIKLVYKYRRNLRKLAKLGYYDKEAVNEILSKTTGGTYDDGIDRPVQERANEIEGVSGTEITRDAPYTLIEYYGWLELPDGKDDLPIRAVVDKGTERLLAIYSRFYNDPADQGRFDRQQAEYESYLEQVKLFADAMAKEEEVLARLQQPDVPPDESLPLAQQMQRQRPMVPVRPDWMGEEDGPPVPCRRKIIEPFVHAVCIENPDGSYGIGVGTVLEDHQRTMNILLDQGIDQATMANGRPIFKHSNAKLPKGVTTVEPGKIIDVRGIPQDKVDKAFFSPEIPPANPQLFQAVELQRNACDAVSSAPDVLSGERASDETFRGQAGRIEQATMQLSMFTANLVLALNQIGVNNMMLDSQFAPDSETIDLPDPRTGQMIPTRIQRDFYKEDVDIVIGSDLSFKSQAARVAEADDVLGMLTKGVPGPIASIIIPPTIFAEAVRNCLRVRGMHDMASMIPTNQEIEAKVSAPPPGAPPPAPGQGGGPPPPSVPTGTPNQPPGAQPPQTKIPPSVARAGAPMRTR